MRLSEPQKTVANDTARFVVLCTGRRFGKSTLGIRQLFYHARLPDQNCWAVLPSYRMARNIWWDKVKKRAIELNWAKKINEADLSIVLKNGSKICLRGADNPEALRGVGLNYIFIDEAASVDAKAFYEILRPTLSDTGGRCMMAGTPKGIGNWFYDIFQQGQDPSEKDWSSYSFTTVQGTFVPEEEIEAARRDLDLRTFKAEYEGTFVNFEGKIAYNFDRAHNVKDFTFNEPQRVIHVGIDMNVNPMTAAIFVIKDGLYYFIDEIEMHGSNTDELAEEIIVRYPNTKIFAYPDPACRQRRSSAGSRTDLSILQNAGLICKVPSSHALVRDRINAFNSKLCNGAGERQIIIHPRCKRLINALERHVYKDGTNQPDKNSGFDHMFDAASYPIQFLSPVTREHNYTQQPTTWGVKV